MIRPREEADDYRQIPRRPRYNTGEGYFFIRINIADLIQHLQIPTYAEYPEFEYLFFSCPMPRLHDLIVDDLKQAVSEWLWHRRNASIRLREFAIHFRININDYERISWDSPLTTVLARCPMYHTQLEDQAWLIPQLNSLDFTGSQLMVHANTIIPWRVY